jgi:hypothetical protein
LINVRYGPIIHPGHDPVAMARAGRRGSAASAGLDVGVNRRGGVIAASCETELMGTGRGCIGH